MSYQTEDYGYERITLITFSHKVKPYFRKTQGFAARLIGAWRHLVF